MSIVVGEAIYREKVKPFILKINLEGDSAEVIKVLGTND